MRAIDAHIHLYGESSAYVTLLRRLETRAINICYAHTPGAWQNQRDHYRMLSAKYQDCYAWCTTFDPPDLSQPHPDYVDRVIDGLRKDFDTGAVACKIWKNIGMEVRHPAGEYLMVDDPMFDPIFDFIASEDRPVLMHIGEPRACWLPLDERSPHFAYYSQNPEWHMYGKDDVPSHEELIAARDHVVAAHPEIRFIGAHLGSLEYDVREVAKRLDTLPNFAVDTSARIPDLALQDTGLVREFMVRYADRVLYGSDFIPPEVTAPADTEVATYVQELGAVYEAEHAYLTQHRRGLHLPERVSRKIMLENARTWYAM